MSVLVTDARGNHALAVVRSLGRRGVRVVAADCARITQAGFSRYCAGRAVYPSPARGVERFQEHLLRIVEATRPELLMPMTEKTLTALAPIRDAVEARVALAPLPPPRSLDIAFDKEATIRLAASLGVRTPRTAVVHDLADLDEIAARLSWPAVIKPRRSESLAADGRIVTGGAVEYCRRPDDLGAAYRAVHRRTPFPLIQEFVPGEGFGISMLYDRGRMRALFAHRRLRMLRPTGSGSSLREGIAPPADMVDAARRLLEALAWHGVAMVEFKRDARDGAPTLMEINGRFWNSLPLAVASGVDFPWLLYTLATRGDCPECLAYRPGIRGRWLAGDARHLLAVMRGRPSGWSGPYPTRLRSLREFCSFGGADVHYDDLWRSDPLPFFAGLAGALLQK